MRALTLTHSPVHYDNWRWRALLVAGIGLLAAMLVACGGGNDEGDTVASSAGAGEMALAPSAAQTGANPSAGSFADEDRARAEEGAPFSGGAMSAGSDGGGSSANLAGVLGRQVIRNGSVDLTVESVDDSFERVRQVAETAGGYVAGSTFTGRDEFQRAYLTLRVPAEEFGDVIEALRGMAVEVNSVSTGTQDVTEEYTDLEAQLRNLQAVEQQYLTLLGEANEIGDILQVQDRLSGVRFEIERVQGRLNVLDNQTSLATVEVTLSPESAPSVGRTSEGFGDRIQEAWSSSLETLADLGTGIAVALVWAWWLVPFVIAGLVLAWRLAGRLRRVDSPESAA